MSELIAEFVSPEAFAQLDKLESRLEKSTVLMSKAIIEAERLNKTIAGASSTKQFEEAQAKSETALKNLEKATKQLEIAETKLKDARKKSSDDFERSVQKETALIEKKAKASGNASEKERLAQIKLDQDRKKAFDNYEKGLNKKAAADKKDAERIAKNSRAYTVLSNELERQRGLAQDLAIIYGETSPEFLNAAKGVIELDTRLKAIDATLGKNQRNVGHYERGFNQFGNAINQLSRELPALAVNAQTFFLAISNNLPALFDAIQQANQAQKEAKKLAKEDAEAKGESAKATELAAGATEEAASAAGDFAKEQALAAAEAIKTPGAFKQFIGSLFSLQTALSLGVTLLTIYGAEIVKYISEIIKGGQATDIAAKKFENLNKAFDDPAVADAVKNVAELKINIGLAKDGILSKEKVLNQYNETIGKTTGEVKTLDEAEKQLGKNAKAYVEMTLFKAAAQLTLDEAAKASVEAAKEAADNERKLAKQQNAAVITGDKEGEAVRKILVKDRKRVNQEQIKDAEESNKELLDIAEAFQKKAADIAKANKFDFFGGENSDKTKKNNTDAIDLLIQRAQAEADAAKRISDDQANSLDLRLENIKRFSEASIRVSEITAERELSESDLTKERVIAIKEAQKNEERKIIEESASLTVKLNQDAEKELAKLIKDGLKNYEEGEKKKILALQVSLAEQQQKLSEFADSALLGLAEQYSKGIISEKQYADGKLEIQRQYVLDSINEELKGVEAIIAAKKKAGLDTADDEKQLAELRKKISKETADQEIADLERVAARNEQLKDLRIQFLHEIGNLTATIVNAGFENEKNKIQEQIDLNEQKKQIDIDNVANSVANEEDKANKIRVIEAQAEARKDALEIKQREVAIRQAKFKKAMDVASIISNTAVAIMKTYAEFGFPLGVPLAIAQGAIGAVQIATVLATPIPTYFTGTDSSKGGLAMTDELGPEGYITPSGEVFIGNDKPTLRNLEKGTKIIPHHEMVSLMGNPGNGTKMKSDKMDVALLIASQQAENKKLIKAIGKQKTQRYTRIELHNMGDYISRNF